jgi:hypothetical protein
MKNDVEYAVHLRKRHEGQRQVVQEARRFNVLSLGRRWGKTTLGIDIAVSGYTSVEGRTYAGLLDGGYVAWFAPSYKYLLEAWRELVHAVRPLVHSINSSDKRLTLITGGVFEAWTLDNPDAGRGRKYDLAIVDEAAMVDRLMDTWSLAIRPTLADREGAAWFLSTPKGHNAFYRLYSLGQDADPAWRSWKMPSETNPHVPAHEIQAMRESLPERVVAQEIDAAFMADGGGVFRKVRDAIDRTPRTGYDPACTYTMGADWGRTNDFTVLTVYNVTKKRVEHIERFTGIGYDLQTQRLRALAQRYRVQTVVAESNSMGGPVVESLQRLGLPVIPFATTGESKGPLIEALSLGIESGAVQLLPDDVLIAELTSYELQRLPSGRYRYSAPDGQHDDCVISLALAYYAVTSHRPALY